MIECVELNVIKASNRDLWLRNYKNPWYSHV